MPNTPLIITRDLLPSICQHLLDIRALGALCCADRTCMRFLMDPCASGKAISWPYYGGAGFLAPSNSEDVISAPHWLRAGKHLCGEEFWNETLFDRVVPGPKDGRYIAMLHLCPWRSAPVVFPLRSLQAYESLDATFELMDMKVTELRRDGDCYYHGPDDSKVVLLVSVRDNDHVKGGPRVVYRMARDEDAVDTMYSLDAIDDDDERFVNPYSITTDAIARALRSDGAFVRAANRYGLGPLAEVRLVHQNMYAAIFEEGRTWRYSTVLFCDLDTHRVLHELRFRDGHPRCVAFRPGEMWLATTAGELVYHGPSKDRHLAQGNSYDGRIARAFFETIHGRAHEALRLLAPLRIPDLSRLYIPKTALSLLDVAADPLGEAFSQPCPGPLTPDAAMLLGREPRFAHGVFMLKCAIRRMDTDAIRAIVQAGAPWISSDDVLDAMPRGMPYADGLDVIKPCGVRISYRY